MVCIGEWWAWAIGGALVLLVIGVAILSWGVVFLGRVLDELFRR